ALVPGQRRRRGVRSGVGNTDQVEQALDAAVLPRPSVQGEEHQLDVLLVQLRDQLLVEVEVHDTMATVAQRLGHTLTRPEADLTLEAGSTGEHRDGHDVPSPSRWLYSASRSSS